MSLCVLSFRITNFLFLRWENCLLRVVVFQTVIYKLISLFPDFHLMKFPVHIDMNLQL